MASEPAEKNGQILSTVCRCLKTFTVNSYRRLLMVGHYTLICLHQQRLRRAWRALGQRLQQAVEEGEDNPLLNESVQENLNRAEVLKRTKERHYQAVANLREKVQASRAESPAATDASSESTAESEEGQV